MESRVGLVVGNVGGLHQKAPAAYGEGFQLTQRQGLDLGGGD